MGRKKNYQHPPHLPTSRLQSRFPLWCCRFPAENKLETALKFHLHPRDWTVFFILPGIGWAPLQRPNQEEAWRHSPSDPGSLSVKTQDGSGPTHRCLTLVSPFLSCWLNLLTKPIQFPVISLGSISFLLILQSLPLFLSNHLCSSFLPHPHFPISCPTKHPYLGSCSLQTWHWGTNLAHSFSASLASAWAPFTLCVIKGKLPSVSLSLLSCRNGNDPLSSRGCGGSQSLAIVFTVTWAQYVRNYQEALGCHETGFVLISPITRCHVAFAGGGCMEFHSLALYEIFTCLLWKGRGLLLHFLTDPPQRKPGCRLSLMQGDARIQCRALGTGTERWGWWVLQMEEGDLRPLGTQGQLELLTCTLQEKTHDVGWSYELSCVPSSIPVLNP